MQQEMVRFRTGQSNAMRILAKSAFEPMWDRSLQLVADAIGSGELCNVDPMQMMYATLGANVFYFLSAPMVRLVNVFLTPWNRAHGGPAHSRYPNTSAKPSLPTADGAHVLPNPCSPPCPSRAAAIPERKTA